MGLHPPYRWGPPSHYSEFAVRRLHLGAAGTTHPPVRPAITKGTPMYIGGGLILLILIIIVVVALMR